MKKIKVNLDKRVSSSYEICIGYDILDRIGLIIAKNLPARHYVVVTDSIVSPLYGQPLLNRLRGMGLSADMVDFPAGEKSKNVNTTLAIVERLIELGADRSSALLALGGGVVGDITGFIASTFMRSVPYINVPTTLMAQVDSSIGGKTAIDLREGKNLLGTFYQPKGVFIDVKFLDTLPETEFDNGLAEVMKYGIIEDVDLFHFLEEHVNDIKGRDSGVLVKVIDSSCRIKKGIVEIDEKDKGLRRILNFGHTIGHAIEAESAYTISHGIAVSLGMAAAVRVSEKLYEFPGEERNRIENLMNTLGLPCHIPHSLSIEGTLARVKMDKKKEGNLIHFVLLKKMGMPFINGGVPESVLWETLEGLRK
jgi:3-dehydroquinate synthase